MAHRKEFILDDNPLDRVMFSDGTNQWGQMGMSNYQEIAKAAAKIVSDKLGCTMGVRYDPTHYAWVFTVEGYNEPTFVQHHVSDTDTVEWLVKHLEIAISLTRKEG